MSFITRGNHYSFKNRGNKMKSRIITLLLVLFLGSLLLVGCSVETEVSHTISGTVEEILVDKKVIVVKENTEDESLYKVPVGNTERYELEQKVEVTVNKEGESQQNQLKIVD